MSREEVFKVLDGEREYQNSKWSPYHLTDGIPADHTKSVGDFITYMDDYFRKAKEQYTTETGSRGALENLRKVAALAVACFERHGVPERK
jgi:uncharacterized membrane protein